MSININDCCGEGIDNSSTACGCLGDGFVEQSQPQVYQSNNSGNLPFGNYVITVNNIPGPYVTLTTTNIPEGTNLYFTNARVYSLFNATAPILFNNSTGNISMQTSGVTAGTYGSATQYSAFTVDIYGRITSTQLFPLPSPVSLGPNLLAIQAIPPANTGILTDLGNGSWVTRNLLPAADNSVSVSSYLTGDVTIGLPNSGVTAGTYGNNISTLTAIVNGKGVLTSLTSVPINFPASQTPNFWQIPGVNANVQYNQSTNPIPQGTTLTYDTASNTWGNFGQSGGLKQVYSNTNIFNGLGIQSSILDINIAQLVPIAGINTYNTYYSSNNVVLALITIGNVGEENNIGVAFGNNVLAVSIDNGNSFIAYDLTSLNTSSGVSFGSLAYNESTGNIYIGTTNLYGRTNNPIKIYTANLSSSGVLGSWTLLNTGATFANNEQLNQITFRFSENSSTGGKTFGTTLYLLTNVSPDPSDHQLKFYKYDTSTLQISSTTLPIVAYQQSSRFFDFDKNNGNFIFISGFFSNGTTPVYDNNIQYYSTDGGNTFASISITFDQGAGGGAVADCIISNNILLVAGNPYINNNTGQYLLFSSSIPETGSAPTFTDISNGNLPNYIYDESTNINGIMTEYDAISLSYISQNRFLLHIAGNGLPPNSRYNGSYAHCIFDYSAGGTITSSNFIKLSNGAFDHDYSSLGYYGGAYAFCSPLKNSSLPILDFSFIDWERWYIGTKITNKYWINKTNPVSNQLFNILYTGLNNNYIANLDYNKLFNVPLFASNPYIFNGVGTQQSPLNLNSVQPIKTNGINQNTGYYSTNRVIFLLMTTGVYTGNNYLAISTNNGGYFSYIDLTSLNLSSGVTFNALTCLELSNNAYIIYIASGFNYTGISQTQKIYTIKINVTGNNYTVGTPVAYTSGINFAANENIVQMKYKYTENSDGSKTFSNSIFITTVTFSSPLATHTLKFYNIIETQQGVVATVLYNTLITTTAINYPSAFYFFDFDKSTATNIAISGALISSISPTFSLFAPANFTVYFSSNSGNTFSTITTNTVNSNQIVVDSVCISTNLIMIGANVTVALTQYSSLFFTAPVQASPTFTDNSTFLPGYISNPPSATNDIMKSYKTVDIFYISQNRMLLHIIGNGYQTGGGGNGAEAHAIFDYSTGTILPSNFSKLLPNSNNNYGFFDTDRGNTLGSDYGNYIFCSPLLNTTAPYDFSFIDWERYIGTPGITDLYFYRNTNPRINREVSISTGITDNYIADLDYNKLFNTPIQSIDTTTPISVSGTNIYLNVDQNGKLKLSLTAQT